MRLKISGIFLASLSIASPRIALAGPGSYQVFAQTGRGTVTLNGASLGAFTATSSSFSFQGTQTNGNFSSPLNALGSLFLPSAPAGSLTLSYPGGTAGLAQPPLALGVYAPETSSPVLYVLDPRSSLNLSLTYSGSSVSYNLGASAIDTHNQASYSLSENATISAGSNAPDSLNASLILRSATETIIERLSGIALAPDQTIAPGFVLDALGVDMSLPTVFQDGSTPGSMEIKDSIGGGAIEFTNPQLYTGPTLVDPGATLALAGSGALATSSSVTDDGTLNLASSQRTLSIASYAQGSNASLVETASPGSASPLSVTGEASLGGILELRPAGGTYAIGHYPVVTAGALTGRFSTVKLDGTASSQLGYALAYADHQVVFDVSPNVGLTQSSIQQVASGISGVNGLGMYGLTLGLGADCGAFAHGRGCVSVGFGSTREAGAWRRDASVTFGYALTPHWRIGVVGEQALGNTSIGGVAMRARHPMFGGFVGWRAHTDGTGLGLTASAAATASTLALTRYGSAYSETASGATISRGHAFQLVGTYTVPITPRTRVTPYFGLRVSELGIGAYTETGAAYPLSFNGVRQGALDAMLGASLDTRVAPRLSACLSAGVTQNLRYRAGAVSGTSAIPGLASFRVALPGSHYTSLGFGAGLAWDLGHGQSLGLQASIAEHQLARFSIAGFALDYTAAI